MKVRFAQSILDDPSAWSELDRIVDFFWEGRHVWIIDDPAQMEQSRWIQSDMQGRAGLRNREALEKFVTRSAYPAPAVQAHAHALAIVVTTTPSGSSELLPDKARKCLESPAYVLVENSTSDGAFLRAMVKVLQREALLLAMTQDWCRIDHLGGFGEVAKRVEEIRARHPGPLRVFVLADSDRLFPGHVTPVIRQVTGYCESNGVPFAILAKRKIENYLPGSVLHSVNRKKFIAYIRLTDVQRDHYDLKKGFPRDSRKRAIIPQEQADLFANVSPSVLRDLCGGFGAEVWRCFETEFHRVSEQDIRVICRADPKEIDRILDAIDALL